MRCHCFLPRPTTSPGFHQPPLASVRHLALSRGVRTRTRTALNNTRTRTAAILNTCARTAMSTHAHPHRSNQRVRVPRALPRPTLSGLSRSCTAWPADMNSGLEMTSKRVRDSGATPCWQPLRT